MKFRYFCLLSFKNITFHCLFQYGRLFLFVWLAKLGSSTGKLKMAGDKNILNSYRKELINI